MLCEICKKNPVKVKIVKVVNGKKIEKNVCETCARVHENIKIQEAKRKDTSQVEELLKNAQTLDSILDEMKDKQCILCGMDMKKFVKTGKLGCTNCYSEFKDTIDFLIDKIQNPEKKEKNAEDSKIKSLDNDIKHEAIKKSGKYTESSIKLRKLKRELKKKLKDEAYEEAAQIRDEITTIEKAEKQGEQL